MKNVTIQTNQPKCFLINNLNVQRNITTDVYKLTNCRVSVFSIIYFVIVFTFFTCDEFLDL